MYSLEWIYLQTPDTVFLELSTAKNPRKREELLESRSEFPMPMGAHVLGHSQLGFSVSGSEEDRRRLEIVHGIIWNGKSPQEDAALSSKGNRAASSRLRDSMIVATTIRYAHKTLITEDQGLLRASNALGLEFQGFRIINIRSATSMAKTAIARVRHLMELNLGRQSVQNLPDWP